MLKKILFFVICVLLLLSIISILPANGTWQIAWEPVLDSGFLPAGARNYRNVCPADVSAFDGSKVRVTVTASANGAATLDGMSIGQMTNLDDMDNPANGTFKRITWTTAGGGNGITCAADVAKVSDELTFAFDKTKRYGFHVYVAERANWMYDNTGDGLYFNTPGIDDTLTQNVAYGFAGETEIITKVEVYVAGDGEDNAIFFGFNFLALVGIFLFVPLKRRFK